MKKVICVAVILLLYVGFIVILGVGIGADPKETVILGLGVAVAAILLIFVVFAITELIYWAFD
jgi:hypothetical protein